LRRFLDGLYLASGAIGAIFVLLIAVLMIGQSVLRKFDVPTGAVNDVVAWFCAAASFFAMAHAFKHGDFVRVTLLMDHLGDAAAGDRRLSVGAVAVAYLAFWANKFTYDSWAFRKWRRASAAAGLIPQASFALGSLLLLVAVVDELVIARRQAGMAAVEERFTR
jgi:TRAP-type C4-dicarboxylate transport system permease small subunit